MNVVRDESTIVLLIEGWLIAFYIFRTLFAVRLPYSLSSEERGLLEHCPKISTPKFKGRFRYNKVEVSKEPILNYS